MQTCLADYTMLSESSTDPFNQQLIRISEKRSLTNEKNNFVHANIP
jgi:hypothetical protein